MRSGAWRRDRASAARAASGSALAFAPALRKSLVLLAALASCSGEGTTPDCAPRDAGCGFVADGGPRAEGQGGDSARGGAFDAMTASDVRDARPVVSDARTDTGAAMVRDFIGPGQERW